MFISYDLQKIMHTQQPEPCNHDELSQEDRILIDEIAVAYDQTAINIESTYTIVCNRLKYCLKFVYIY